MTQSVLEDVRKVMGSDAGLDVLLALLRALECANEFVVVEGSRPTLRACYRPNTTERP